MGALPAQTQAATSVPKAYGTNFQSLHVGAAAFRPVFNFSFAFEGVVDGYVYNYANGSVLDFAAPVTLPPGAEIHALCAYLFDADSEREVQVQLRAARLVPGGPYPGVVDVGPLVVSGFDTGYDVTCVEFAPPYTYSETAGEDDVALAHYLQARVPPFGGIGGVKIIWRQQVSPPPASPSFGDVPADHVFFQFVEALAASGITAGCGGGNYCPDQPLTRGQMAAFLSKALGLHWPN